MEHNSASVSNRSQIMQNSRLEPMAEQSIEKFSSQGLGKASGRSPSIVPSGTIT